MTTETIQAFVAAYPYWTMTAGVGVMLAVLLLIAKER